MKLPEFYINVGYHRYYRTHVNNTTKSAALAHAKKIRKEGHLARVVETASGWTTYMAANPRRRVAFERELPKEIK